MNKKITKIAVILFIVLSVITVGIIAFLRMNVERKNNSVEMIIEYQELKKLAAQSDLSIEQWMIEYKSMGMNSVAIMEETLLRYASDRGITYNVAKQLFNEGDWEQLYPEEVITRLQQGSEYNLIIEAGSEQEFNTMVRGLSHYEGIKFWSKSIDSDYYIIVEQTEKDLLYADSNDIISSSGRIIGKNKFIYGSQVLYAPIGFDEEKIRLIEESGLKLVLRPVNYDKDPMGAWNLYKSEIAKYGTGSGLLLFDGEGVVGFGSENDVYLSAIQDFVNQYDVNVVILETIEQRKYVETKGLPPVVASLSKDHLVRLFNIWDFVAKRYQYNAYYTGGEEIGNCIYRAVTERNIRAIYFRPFIQFNGNYVTKVEDYKNMFEGLEIRLAEHGYHYGDASTIEEFTLPMLVKMLLTFQIALFGLILINIVVGYMKSKYNIVFIALAALGSVTAHCIAPNMAISLTALAAAIVFSTLSVVYFMHCYLLNPKGTKILIAIKGLVLSSMISLFGALYIGSVMADTEFFLELKLFTGVKASLLLPIVTIMLIVVIYYIKEVAQIKGKSFINEFVQTSQSFLNGSVKIKYGIVLFAIAIVGYIYLARTGNESSLEPSTYEIMLRNFLEEVLLARPRTKEFMLAFPSMIIGVCCAGNAFVKKDIFNKYLYILVFAVVAIVGQSSITNTFSHIRTPLYLSLVRTGYSVVFGMLIGIILVGILKVLEIIFKRIMNLEVFKDLKG
ncbi:MAG: hypothetical protein CVU84_11595 [Firmicutes bacterium HGW-Firmicutes-1]|jgi:hypothetical protein|nr:MAG: hypothetical protein CVU84_11595 [Firmicutes bacterium HGW-Firmicutes-1]